MANVRYLVNDVDAALAFYVGALGFELVERWGPPFAMVRRDDLTLWLSEPVPGGWNRLVLAVDNLDATVAALRAAGTHFRNDAVSGPGGRQILVDDPSGNPVELFEPQDN
jgi:catechol 2,3-dioxygenase-like lactoylglutathione lyase family enzyme